MLVRYAVSMALQPEWRWFGHTIPIVFHCVLATFLMTYGTLLVDGMRPARSRPRHLVK
jgi:ABC-type multidrug transport system permease subunit